MNIHHVDLHVGKKLRLRRTVLGLSQDELGKAVGITFQQVQKYERGLNRIGSSRLYEFAIILGVQVSYFFENIDENSVNVTPTSEPNIAGLSSENADNKEVLSLVRSYYAINNLKIRKKLLSLIKSLGNVEDNETDEVNVDSQTAKQFAEV